MVVRLCSGHVCAVLCDADEEHAKKLIEDVFIIADLINEVNDSRLLKQNAEHNSKKNSKKNSLPLSL